MPSFNPNAPTRDMSAAQVYGSRAGGQTPAQMTDPQSEPGTSAYERVISGASMGQTAAWWLGIVAFLAIFMYATDRLTPSNPFGQIKLSIYNILVISLAAVVGIPFLKLATAKLAAANFPGAKGAAAVAAMA